MAQQSDIEAIDTVGEHRYLIWVLEDEDTIEIRVYARPAVLARLPPKPTRSASCTLIGLQRADELPRHSATSPRPTTGISRRSPPGSRPGGALARRKGVTVDLGQTS